MSSLNDQLGLWLNKSHFIRISLFSYGSYEYDSWEFFKYDTEQEDWGVIASYSSDSVYVSEPLFVPDPNGEEEDDGVLLAQIFNGKKSESALLVLDATNF